MKLRWILLICLTAILAMACNSTQDAADEIGLTEESVELAIDHFDAPETAPANPPLADYVSALFGNVANVSILLNLGLPGYAYHQGLVYTEGNVLLAGQVRVVGGMITRQKFTTMGGGMVTTNPDSMVNRVQSVRGRWKVDSWTQSNQ